MKKLTIMILGAGQVGLEVARQLCRHKPQSLILHALTALEVEQAAAQLEKIDAEIDVKKCHGNVLYPHDLAYSTLMGKATSNEQEERLVEFFYGQLTPELVQSAHLYQLINSHRPDIIVDAINTATAVGYHRSVHEEIRQALTDPSTYSVRSIALTHPIPPLVRFVQVLKEAMQEFKVRRYIKVSTTGLGGMGFNIMYTHGDLGEPGLSTKLLGKVAAAGILHQLLWTLSHTPGFNINIVVPAALIGWGELSVRNVRLSGKNKSTQLFDCDPREISSISAEETIQPHVIPQEEQLRSAIVGSGENGDYSYHDMAAITAPGQMGPVSKEEVAGAVLQCMDGDNRYCLLAGMDRAQLLDSPLGYEKRRELMDQMAAMERESNIPSVSFGNLGPQVAKLLWELEIISSVTESLNQAAHMDPEELTSRSSTYIQENALTRQMILTVGLPIVTNYLLYTIERGSLIEIQNSPSTVTLTMANMKLWQGRFQQICAYRPKAEEFSNAEQVRPDKKILSGELLGFYFTITGGGKKRDFQPSL